MINKLKEKLAKEETKPGSSEHFAFGGLSGPASLDLVADVIAVLEAQAGEIARLKERIEEITKSPKARSKANP